MSPDSQDRAESVDADKFGGEEEDVRRRMPPEEPTDAMAEVLEGGTGDNLTNTTVSQVSDEDDA